MYFFVFITTFAPTIILGSLAPPRFEYVNLSFIYLYFTLININKNEFNSEIFVRLINFLKDIIKSIIILFVNDKSKFFLIYKLGYWNSRNGSKKSRVGSNLNSTENIRDELTKFIKKKNKNSI